MLLIWQTAVVNGFHWTTSRPTNDAILRVQHWQHK